MPVFSSRAPVRGPIFVRWTLLLIGSLLLHLLFLQWVNRGLMPATLADTPEPAVIAATLIRPPPPPIQAPAHPAAVKPMPKRERPPAPRNAPRSVPKTAPQPAPAPAVTPVLPATEALSAPLPILEIPPDAAAELATAVEDSAANDADPSPAGVADVTQHAAELSAPAPLFFDPPPSAELEYKVLALRDGQTWHGNGLIRWEANASTYRVSVEASIWLFFKITVLSSTSEGMLTTGGIQPVLYTEKPFRKALTNTHFQHGNRLISFSASQKTYPYRGNEQDRASVVWQLAGLGRAHGSEFRAGSGYDIVVAGTRDAEAWQIGVQGEETLTLPEGTLSAWRLTRQPRPGSHDARIDIWLAPARDWYPVRLRYTYRNGDYLDLALHALTPLMPLAPSPLTE